LHPLFAVGLVYSLIGSKNEHIRNPEQAFGRIEALGICSYDSAKRAYYQGLREDRFRGVLFKLPGLQAIVQDEACSSPTPVVLLPGGSITATLTGNSDKTARIDFRAV